MHSFPKVGWNAVCLTVLLCLATRSVVAEQPRARTLVYDSEARKWVEQAPPPPGTPEGDLHAIRVTLTGGDFRKAATKIDKLIAKYGEHASIHPDALIARAEAWIGRREYQKAHVTLQEFLGAYAGHALTAEALRLEFVIAETFLSGVKRKIVGVRLVSGEDLALKILDQIGADHPDSEFAELAVKTKADYFFEQGDHGLAEIEYARLNRDYPRSRYRRFAQRRFAEVALAAFRGTDYDQAQLIDAEERFGDYRGQYPGEAAREGVELILDGIRESRAQKNLSIADYYEGTEHLSSAVFYYRLVVSAWPETIAANRAATRLELLGAPDPVSARGKTSGAPSAGN